MAGAEVVMPSGNPRAASWGIQMANEAPVPQLPGSRLAGKSLGFFLAGLVRVPGLTLTGLASEACQPRRPRATCFCWPV
jgi:hypothetical protein